MMNQDYGNQEALQEARDRIVKDYDFSHKLTQEYSVDLKDLEAILATHKDELGGEG
ncbi:TPA: hypothetical protein ACIONB_001744 [Streptococcus agalactiae]